VALFVSLLVLGMTWVIDERSQDRQEVLENVRFVRQVASDGKALKPFNGINLKEAQLGGLDLSCERLGSRSCANFIDADMSRANFSMASLSGAILSGADLSHADLSRADLKGALLSNANLTGANLAEANLVGSHLRRAKLEDANLAEVCYDELTRWPANYVPPVPPSKGLGCRPLPRPQPVPQPRPSPDLS
jgi:uncharacterized protein YjbI with pentapeptide repeats